MSNGSNTLTSSRCGSRPEHIYAHVDIRRNAILAAEPVLKLWPDDGRDRRDALCHSECSVRLQKHSEPVVGVKRCFQEPYCRSRIDLYRIHCFVSRTRPENVARLQSAPLKSASMVVASAVPKLPNVPRQPRGEL